VFTGFVSDEDLVGLVRHAALLVYPSLYEGLGLPVLEAYACGTPVVGSDTSSIAELVLPELACDPQRQTRARLRLGGAVDFVLSPNWNVWALFEGVLAQPRDHRRLLSGFLADAADLRIYPRAGVTYKF
jgi:glycosyltransferase involved in cell wall biosynthesis